MTPLTNKILSCKECGKLYKIALKNSDFEKWLESHDLIQNCFPYLSPGERELLKTSICDKCYDQQFGFGV